MSDIVDEFEKLLHKAIKQQVPIQTQWVRIQNVRKDEMLCDAKDIHSDLDFYDVWLGLGSEVKIPTNNTTALIGLIENNPAKAFLITCEELDGFSIKIEDNNFEITKDLIKLYSDSFGGLVKVKELTDKINRLENKLNDLINKHNTHTHITTATVVATPVAGVITPTAMTETQITPITNRKDIENEKVKHGG